jgi:flagellar motility protein MotE (MotC chaperone)
MNMRTTLLKTGRALTGSWRRVRVLPIMIALVALVITVRVGEIWQVWSVGAGSPLAAQTTPATEPAGMAPTEVAVAPADAGTVAFPADDPLGYTPEEIDVLESLAQRRQALDERERQLADREALLAAAEQRIDAKIVELKAVQLAVEGMANAQEQKSEDAMKSLVKIYESMKPKEAASILQELDPDVLLDVVDRMKEQKAALVLALMDPIKAQAVTQELARRAEIPPLPQ